MITFLLDPLSDAPQSRAGTVRTATSCESGNEDWWRGIGMNKARRRHKSSRTNRKLYAVPLFGFDVDWFSIIRSEFTTEQCYSLCPVHEYSHLKL